MKSAVLHREWSLAPGDTAAVPGIRHRIMSELRHQAEGDADLWSAELVVAELLSNAVVHTSGPASVSLSWDGDHPLLSVTDAGRPGEHPLPQPERLSQLFADAAGHRPHPMADGGRGLFLVSCLALDVTVAVSRAGGSEVSVILDVARQPDHAGATS